VEDRALLDSLTPVAEKLLERHLSTAKEWFPHEFVPWSQGRDFEPGEPFVDPGLPPGVGSALFVNLLTEDNLPYYFNDIYRMFGGDGPWGEWARRWTAEEGRHSIAIRDYLTVTRRVDPVALERARMVQVSGGETPHPLSAADGFAYVALQELATRVAHYNTGKAIDDPAGYEVMKRVAADENLHYLFYRDMVSAALDIDPSGTIEAIERQVVGFDMPGQGIPGFVEHAKAIAGAGIYNLAIHHQSILEPVVVRHWKIGEHLKLTSAAAEAQDRIVRFMQRSGRVAARLAERAAAKAESVLVPGLA
jgi:acyl-[acyl-carrier-protein] desaturase